MSRSGCASRDVCVARADFALFHLYNGRDSLSLGTVLTVVCKIAPGDFAKGTTNPRMQSVGGKPDLSLSRYVYIALCLSALGGKAPLL